MLETVHKASQAILSIYENRDRFAIDFKQDDSPLTDADRASNDIICEQLAVLSSFPIISEESRQRPYSDRSTFEYCWMVDPLDGTKEFIKRNGEFTINIALIKGGEAILGMMHVPVTGSSYFAAKGDGAYRMQHGLKSQIHCRPFHPDAAQLGVVCSRSHLSEATQSYVDNYDDPELVPKGSALKFTVIAEGKADLYPRLGPTMEWDTAAAQVILEQAGGQVLDFVTRAPLQYNKEVLVNPHFVACGKGTLK